MKHLLLAALIAIPLPAAAEFVERPTVDLVAMSTFVDTFCPGMRMNRAAARRAFYASGGTPEWNENPYHRTLVRLRMGVLSGDPSRSCARFFVDFGPEGVREPGLIEQER